MIEWIKKILHKKTVEIVPNKKVEEQVVEDPSNFVWCLIGNVVNEQTFGPEKEIKHGTSHFSPNTKVYCLPSQWGDGYENIKVIGRHRDNGRYVCIVMPAKRITNWRLQKVYRPYVLNVMKSQQGWTNRNEDKEAILEMIKHLRERSNKMKE